jgi:uncharacterized membrane protein YsdA (DUF1294 family)
MAAHLSWIVIAYLAAINAATYWAFRADKIRASRGEYRIAEKDLLLLAAAGGTPAALYAQRHLHHKTRKQPFANMLLGLATLQTCLLIGYFALGRG